MRLLKPTISVPRAIAESWSRKGSGGSGLSLRFDDLNSVGEPYTENYFRQLVVAIEATPAFLGGLGSLKIMASAVLFDRHPLERIVRWRTVANELSMGLVVRRCFQCSAGKS